MALNVGDPAPDFALPASTGATIALKDLRGKKVVLYFYPKDDTPGCTKEACGFRDVSAELKAAGAEVLGVSADGLASHKRFAEKYGLSFPLLADTEKTAANAYGAWGEKTVMGRKTIGMRRMTFLIDEQGRIARVWPKVSPEGHAAEVLAAVRGD